MFNQARLRLAAMFAAIVGTTAAKPNAPSQVGYQTNRGWSVGWGMSVPRPRSQRQKRKRRRQIGDHRRG